MVNVREAQPDDAKRISEIYGYYVENTAISFEYDRPTPDEMRRRIEKTTQRFPYLVAEEDGTVVGFSYAGPLKERKAYDRSCEVSIYVDRAARGRGTGRLLYDALEDALRKQGILNLYACIAYPREEDEYLTANSANFHAHLGYRKVGELHQCGNKFGRWYNMIWMEKIIGEHV